MTEKITFSNPSKDIHYRLAEWAAVCAEHTLYLFENSNSDDARPRKALETLREWIQGDKTMVECRTAAFAAHAAARDATDPAAIAAARAAGQAVAVAHMYNHCSHAADYAAKAIKLYTTQYADETFKTERKWQREHLAEDLWAIGFPKEA